jgi:hypothetical protein
VDKMALGQSFSPSPSVFSPSVSFHCKSILIRHLEHERQRPQFKDIVHVDEVRLATKTE